MSSEISRKRLLIIMIIAVVLAAAMAAVWYFTKSGMSSRKTYFMTSSRHYKFFNDLQNRENSPDIYYQISKSCNRNYPSTISKMQNYYQLFSSENRFLFFCENFSFIDTIVGLLWKQGCINLLMPPLPFSNLGCF